MFAATVGSLPHAFGNGAKFSVESDRGCAPFTVHVIDESTAPAAEVRTYNYNDPNVVGGNDDTNLISYTYNTPGTYYIVQTIQNVIPRTDTVMVTVLDPTEPEYSIVNCEGTSLTFFPGNDDYNGWVIEWGDGNETSLVRGQIAQHDYGVLGDFTIQVYGLADGLALSTADANNSCGTSSTNVTLTGTLAPATFQSAAVANLDALNGVIDLQFFTGEQTLYQLEYSINGGAYIPIDTIPGTNAAVNYTIENLNTLDNYYCFRISALDLCNSSVHYPDEICSINLTLDSDNEENYLNWNSSPLNVLSYDIYKGNTLLTSISDPSQDSYIDTDVVCGSTYCYSIEANISADKTSISSEVCITASSGASPPQVNNISADVEGNNIVLQWPDPPGGETFTYTILKRGQQSGAFSSIGNTTITEFTDSQVRPGSLQYNYRINYQDLCGNFAGAGIIASPVLLRYNKAGLLTWTEYEGWESGVSEYVVQISDLSGLEIENVSVGSDTSYVLDVELLQNQQIQVRILVQPFEMNLPFVHSNMILVNLPALVFFPNAFTPNGDGLNDIFTFESKFVRDVDFRVYTRWGELVFRTEELGEGWDGQAGGRPAPSGTYVYNAQLIDEAGNKIIKTGEIILIR